MPFYTVYKGIIPGIYESWDECKLNVHGYKGAIYKKFSNKNEAEIFMKNGTIEKKKIDPISENNKFKNNNHYFNSDNITNNTNIIYIYTDGSCINNGQYNAIAGIGIYFGDDDPHNISEGIEGSQTNNIAELKAIDKAIDIMADYINTDKEIVIYTDSVYAIRCYTTYGEKLEDNNWDMSENIPNIVLIKKIYLKYKKIKNIELRHIKAHTNSKDPHSIGNKKADILAYNAICKSKSKTI